MGVAFSPNLPIKSITQKASRRHKTASVEKFNHIFLGLAGTTHGVWYEMRTYHHVALMAKGERKCKCGLGLATETYAAGERGARG